MKSPEMEKFLNKVALDVFGRERNGKQCVTCGSIRILPSDFRDELSYKEFQISFMCQKCQDETFKGSDDYD
jgi:hypothetical protein